ncbi:hypothetical protein VKT23_019388 [Stygiomarasmius scandens]|uniref:Uncharacterized protein n=1 Tax=Marasmiellus scandens TaxID=2682957 RepID=A0ABR1ILL0_9AGAR
MYFYHIEAADKDFKIPDHLQLLILLSKLPDTYKTVIGDVTFDQITVVKQGTIENLKNRVIMVFEGTGKGKRKDAGKQAQKLSAVKRKREDPKFKQQQHQNSGNDATNQGGNQNLKGRSKCAGKGKGKGCQHDDHGHSYVATTARIPLTASLPDPCTKNTFDLARDMGVKPSTQQIKFLEPIIHGTQDIKMSEYHQHKDKDAPVTGPSTPSLLSRMSQDQPITWADDDCSLLDKGVSLGSMSDVDEDIAEAAGFDDQSVYYSDDEDRDM